MPQPNVLIIVLDQLSWFGVGRSGHAAAAATPAMDALAARGRHLQRCYCSYPLCQPSRASFWTGLLPHRIGVTSNGLDLLPGQTAGNSLTSGSRWSQQARPGLAGFRTGSGCRLAAKAADWPSLALD
ncbi:MAG: sulfatase-like hydrolase/transferase [Planctomycetota bacterium]